MSGAPRSGSVARTAAWIALASALAFVACGGGRITASDEVTMFELSRAMLHGRIDVPEGSTMTGRDGRAYSKNSAAQAVLALPLVAAGTTAARAAGLPPAKADLAARAVASCFNALVVAALLASFYALARTLGVSAGASLVATAMLGFTTPLFVYAKSFMAEPLESLGLLLALGGAALASPSEAAPRDAARASRVAGLGAFLALASKPSMLPLVLLALVPLVRARPARWIAPAVGLAAALLVTLAYDVARFGTPFESGYGSQGSLASFSTPLVVGAYGLLLSSGKGLAWFAPGVWLAPWGIAAMRRSRAHREAPRHAAAHAAAGAVLLTALAAIVEFGTFQHWGGDGSWGPRYLLPVVPLLFLAVGFALDGASRVRRRIAWALAVAGLLVQLGGVAIHFGAEMRAVGDYPYTLALDDPHFMESSHFDPRFSPIGVHWRMALANASAHLRGDWPSITVGGPGADARLGIAAGEQATLLRALDFWWCYARYAGMPFAPLAAAAAALLALSAWAAFRARGASRAEDRAA